MDTDDVRIRPYGEQRFYPSDEDDVDSESAHPEPNRVPGLPNPIHATSGQFSLPGNTGPYPGYTPSGGTAHLASQHKRAKPSMVGFVYDQKTGQPTPIVLQQEPPSVVQQNNFVKVGKSKLSTKTIFCLVLAIFLMLVFLGFIIYMVISLNSLS